MRIVRRSMSSWDLQQFVAPRPSSRASTTISAFGQISKDGSETKAYSVIGVLRHNRLMPLKPTMFIGSSVEGLPIAQAVVEELEYHIDSVIWNQRVFDLSKGTLPALLEATRRFDYAAFILSADDIVRMREADYHVARDNVVFELGMFFGALGSSRCFFLVPKSAPDFHIASDLAGVTSARFDPFHPAGVRAGVTSACNQIRVAVQGATNLESLTGTWIQKWSVVRDSGLEEFPSEAEVVQSDIRVRASWITFGKRYRLDGEIQRGTILTGTWQDQNSGPTYFGTFQLIISPFANEMEGRWIGWSKRGLIRGGEWVWSRTASAPSSS